MNNTTLSQSILKTLAYFDLFNHPLTAPELWRFLWQPQGNGHGFLSSAEERSGRGLVTALTTYEDFLVALDELLGHSQITTKHGYYFLPGRADTITERQAKIVPSDRWLRRARFAARLIAGIPFLKAVVVCNSVGAELATSESDIDVLIITAPRQVWFVRFWCNVILRLTNLRTYGDRSAGKICLSFFIDTDHLDLGPYRVVPDDIHFAYWLFQMVAVYDPNNQYQKLLAANHWTANFLPHSYLAADSGVSTKPSPQSLIKKNLERLLVTTFGCWLNQTVKKWQWNKLKPSLKQAATDPNHHVILQEGILKFHEHDTREYWRKRWLEKS